jgi:hypothetical protein
LDESGFAALHSPRVTLFIEEVGPGNAAFPSTGSRCFTPSFYPERTGYRRAKNQESEDEQALFFCFPASRLSSIPAFQQRRQAESPARTDMKRIR